MKAFDEQNSAMTGRYAVARARVSILVGGVVCASFLAGCVSTEELQRANLETDLGTCSDFGARYGSSSHVHCMLRQQERRDEEQFLHLERSRMSSETTSNNLAILEAARERTWQK